jgi:hypothetical protein
MSNDKLKELLVQTSQRLQKVEGCCYAILKTMPESKQQEVIRHYLEHADRLGYDPETGKIISTTP